MAEDSMTCRVVIELFPDVTYARLIPQPCPEHAFVFWAHTAAGRAALGADFGCEVEVGLDSDDVGRDMLRDLERAGLNVVRVEWPPN